MTTKEYLGQIRNLDRRISAKIEEKEAVKGVLERVTSSLRERVQISKRNTFEDAAAKLADLEDDIKPQESPRVSSFYLLQDTPDKRSLRHLVS